MGLENLANFLKDPKDGGPDEGSALRQGAEAAELFAKETVDKVNLDVLLDIPAEKIAAIKKLKSSSDLKFDLLQGYLSLPQLTAVKIGILAADEFPESLIRTLVEQQEFGLVIAAAPQMLEKMPNWCQSELGFTN